MGTLQVGRVGLDIVLSDPQQIGERARNGEWAGTITGYLRASTLAETQALRTELLNHVGDLIPIVYSTDATIDGFYILDDVTVDADWRDGALQGRGYLRFSLDVTRIGSYAQTELQSLLTLVSAVEDFSTTPSYWWAPAIGAQAVDAGGGTPVLIDRDGADGTIAVATDMPNVDPSWSIDPSDYYDGAVEIWAGDRLRTGLDMPMDPADWYLSNSLMQIRPGGYQTSSDGELEVRFHDGSNWGDWIPFQIDWAGTNKIPSWNYVSIIRNTAEVATIRLVRDAAESPFSTTTKHELDLTLRRGGRFFTAVYKFTGGTGYQHAVAQADTAATARPLSASYVYGTATISGDTWVLGCPRDFTLSGSQIQLDVAAESMPFWIGAAVDNAANGTGNGPADLAEQYVGQVAETVRAVRR